MIPALESDPSTEDEDGVDVAEPSGKVNLAQLEDGTGTPGRRTASSLLRILRVLRNQSGPLIYVPTG